MSYFAPSGNIPKTVTFNPLPADEAAYRSARLGGRAIGATLGMAAALLALVALIMALNMAASLAATWSELLTLGLIAAGVVAAMCGLPIASAMMQRSYPVEARRAMSFWLIALAVVALAAMLVAGRLERPGARDRSVRLHAAPLGAPPVRSRFMTSVIWQDTDGCRAPHTLYHDMVCEEFHDAMQQRGISEADRPLVADDAPTDWSPSGVLGVAGVGDGYLRRLAVLFLNLFAVAGAGILGRWATLATAESYRLGEGMASALPAAPVAASMPMQPAGNIIGPQEAFDMWVSGRLQPDPVGEVAGDAAYRDYAETMRINNQSAMSPNRFGTLLTRFAEMSGGRVMKLKSNGVQVYRGVRLPIGAGGR